jgi:acyl-CoA synthetase (AMP-forming)/AMP-acid ligase II
LHAQETPHKTAVVFEGREITFGQLMTEVDSVSGYFADKLGNNQQQVVALLATNSIEFIITHLAILHAGHITMPLDPSFKKLEIDAVLQRLKPAMLVYQAIYSDKFSAHQAFTSVGLAEISRAQPNSQKKYLRLAADKQIATITFTSGTSGEPKGVPNTHANHAWNIYACSKIWDWTSWDNLLVNLPLSHMHGLVIGLSGCIYHGNTMYLQQQSFDTEAVLKLLASGKITFFTHGPIAYARLLEAEHDYDISRVRLFISGSAPLPPTLWQEFSERYGVGIIETYGTSETGRIAGNLPGYKRLGTPGKAMPGVAVRLSGKGEIEVKSPGVFPGYWNNREATAKAMAPGGYWRTGDIGEIKDGYIYLKGRIQERIRKFGHTVSPRDVEWALLENPKVKEAYVLGLQDSSGPNDKIVYFVSGDVAESDLQEYCKANLPFSWRADLIFILESLPRTKNGKPHLKKMKEIAVS